MSRTTLTEPGSPVCSPGWLGLREAADATARATELLDLVRADLADAPAVIRDLGCGTGSMARWLAPRLPGAQRWVLHDRDPELLALARAGAPSASAGGAPVSVTTHRGDITALRAADLTGTSLVTASALLDMFTADEVESLVAACVGAGCAALLALTVTGRVVLAPADPLDAAMGAAFNAHQRRRVGDRRLLGPDAGAAAAAAFGRRGAEVTVRPSPWRLGAAEAALTEEWLRGWVGAACAQQPDLVQPAADYLRRRLAEAEAGELRVVVGHVDLLALPRGVA